MIRSLNLFMYITSLLFCVSGSYGNNYFKENVDMNRNYIPDIELDTVTLGAGCFWCVETIYEQLNGVHSVESGYSGGTTINPTYREVCTGETGHAEVCRISYDPKVISFEDLMEVFFSIHDPTTLNRQGADVGTQYRSVIFYHTDDQRKIAEAYKNQLDESEVFKQPIVTEIVPFEKFYKAEDYHQNYFNNNPNAPYCNFVIAPKVEKFKKNFWERIK